MGCRGACEFFHMFVQIVCKLLEKGISHNKISVLEDVLGYKYSLSIENKYFQEYICINY